MTNEAETYKEKIQIFDLSGKLLGMQDRSEFYDEIRGEYKSHGKVTRQVRTVRVFLMNANGGLYLAKRSRIKRENALLYDKTIGAHIRGNESPEYTVIREAVEELGFPAAVLNDTEFISALSETDLKIIGIFRKIETLNRFVTRYRYKDGTFSEFPQITTIFIGIFDGPVKFKDGETSGIEIYYPDEILQELKSRPDRYTDDIKVLIPRYLDEFNKAVKQIEQSRG
jgi:isopentenyldiphosphate isomerase